MTSSPDGQQSDPYVIARAMLAERIKQLRIDSHMSQRQAAFAAGMKQPSWSRLERASNDPSLTHVLRVQRLFRLDSIESLFGQQTTGSVLGVDDEDR
jgi:transcriptional regulator with XRE-family HTH domain